MYDLTGLDTTINEAALENLEDEIANLRKLIGRGFRKPGAATLVAKAAIDLANAAKATAWDKIGETGEERCSQFNQCLTNAADVLDSANWQTQHARSAGNHAALDEAGETVRACLEEITQLALTRYHERQHWLIERSCVRDVFDLSARLNALRLADGRYGEAEAVLDLRALGLLVEPLIADGDRKAWRVGPGDVNTRELAAMLARVAASLAAKARVEPGVAGVLIEIAGAL